MDDTKIDLIREIITALMGFSVLAMAFILIYSSKGSEEQAWLVVGLVVQFFFTRRTQQATVNEVLKSQPTVTASPGPPAEVVVEPQK